jgi:hypothetical protein
MPFETPWETETEYVVTRTVTEIASLCTYAHNHVALESEDPRTSVTLTLKSNVNSCPTFHASILLNGGKHVEVDLPTDTGVFEVETYLPVAKVIEGSFDKPIEPVEAPKASEAEEQLLKCTAETLRTLDAKLSADLASRFADPKLHEESALLLATFTMRDRSGEFFNILPELARITSERTFSSLLNRAPTPSNTSILASALEHALIGLQAEALKESESLPEGAPFGAWRRILMMRTTGDYRTLEQPAEQSLLEQFEWFNAASAALGAEVAQTRFGIPASVQNLPDWWRILNANSPSVATGHLLSRTALRAEIEESQATSEAYGEGKFLDAASMAKALNAAETNEVHPGGKGAVVVEPIGWYMWAQLQQREICNAVARNFDFLQNNYGSPHDAEAFRDQIDKDFSGLTLYPFVRRITATTEAYYRSAQDQCFPLIHRSPHLVPALVWNDVTYQPPFCARYFPRNPLINEWHRDNPLPGSVYDVVPRFRHPSLTDRADIMDLLKKMHALAPYSIDVTNYLLWKMGAVNSPDANVEAYVTMLDYMPGVADRVALLYGFEDNWDKQLDWLKRSAAINPSFNLDLAVAYRKHRRFQDAADAYILWLAAETDDVLKANNATWLVIYLDEHGRSDDATAIAERSADTGSLGGLEAQGYLYEHRKDFAHALENFEGISARYDNDGPLLGFMLRNKGSGINAGKLEPVLKKHFPDGLNKIDVNAVKPPIHGILINTNVGYYENAKLEIGDVIIGARGFEVSGPDALETLECLSPVEDYTLTIWRGGKRIETPPVLAEVVLGRNLPAYDPNHKGEIEYGK